MQDKIKAIWANRWLRRVIKCQPSALSAMGYTAAPEQVNALLQATDVTGLER